MKDYVPSYPNPDHDDRPEWEKKIRPLFSAAEDKDGEGARPSSLIPVHRPAVIDPLHELNLLRMMQVANERTVRELGPLPPGGLPVQKKRKPTAPYTDFLGRLVPTEPITQENDDMKFGQMVVPAALTAAVMVGACAAPTPPNGSPATNQVSASVSADINTIRSETVVAVPIDRAPTQATTSQKEPRYRESFKQCASSSNGVTVDMMNCINDEFGYQDKRLNIAYKRLHQLLSSSAWEALQDEQRNWLAGRGDGCEVDDDMKGGTGEMLVRADCELRKTAFRADELEALLKQQAH